MLKWFRRWRRRRLDVPKITNTNNHSNEELKKSQDKLKDTILDQHKVKRAQELSDKFAIELEKAMRRSHG